MNTKIIEIELNKLKNTFDIRTKINDDHVLYLAGLIDGKLELPPIKITSDFVIIDGRHRVEAHSFLNLKTIKAEIIKSDGAIDMVKQCVSCNLGGALPPTRGDLHRAITILLNKNYSEKRIKDSFSEILPVSLVKSIIHKSQWSIKSHKINNVLDLEKNGISRLTACEKLGVTPDEVQKRIDELRNKPSKIPQKKFIKEKFTTFNRSTGQIYRRIIEDYDETLITKDQAIDYINYLFDLIKHQERMYRDWERRFIRKIKVVNKANEK